ncbi:hypothetical protein GCM10010435_77200 [Winogradskya consettensis]|uniref:Uncharacterized protein n=1 Tax=Winogradskya consettensis TaxID=113560 RepID=A0A919VZI3_9ACTN|nr:hypothetical protein [Actinoplanes consettensis]GIM74653.1 hypothetical protein Aco04nite_41410 [Actinoplanes consettensis]
MVTMLVVLALTLVVLVAVVVCRGSTGGRPAAHPGVPSHPGVHDYKENRSD